VVGTDPGVSKVTKANELKVPIVDGSMFRDLLKFGQF
jgi:BRCT domain type II-containing protein